MPAPPYPRVSRHLRGRTAEHALRKSAFGRCELQTGFNSAAARSAQTEAISGTFFARRACALGFAALNPGYGLRAVD
jgi:hypothetical protein